MDRPQDTLPKLPVLVLPRGTRLARIHHHRASPWHLASDGHSRFNLEQPAGTCYLAEDPVCSFAEVFARSSAVINLKTVDQYRLSWFVLMKDWRIADLTGRRARGVGLDARIHSSVDYETTRAWAIAIAKAGYDGIRYRARSDLSGSCVSIALFSTPSGPKPRVTSTQPIPPDLVASVQEQFGLKIIPALFREP